ncbi:hypothetical protein [Pusillimonas sp. ANT_WB101]|uniref:hypothetical protein n=1 Tax=Pusillimonas sp. ANT_WB101 TaxID=2597356 RepID=UPI0011EC3B86|nr:hypothetical protein [Pusillimonas sp. ANT_WB101]KAA0889931.1 hypothetical protein FQ179_16370 [Pusillimonas sp. ANT_WB101]
MVEKQTFENLVSHQREAVAALATFGEELQAGLKAKTAELEAIANDPTAHGTHGSHQMDAARIELRSIQGQTETNQEELQAAQRKLFVLEQTLTRTEGATGPSKSERIDSLVRERQAELARLTARRGELSLALLDDPADVGLLEDLDINDEHIATITKQLARYEEARTGAARSDAAAAAAARARTAIESRNKAVSIAQARVAVADKLDEYLAGLAPLLREWGQIDAEVRAEVHAAIMATAPADASLATRTTLQDRVAHASPANCISFAVAQAVCRAQLQDVTKGHLKFEASSVADRNTAGVTAKSLAEKAIARLAGGIDEALQHMEVTALG